MLEDRAGGFFDQLLMAALHGAVALPEMDGVAVVVGQDLHFDVPAEFDVFFDVDGGVLEGVFGFGLGLLEAGLEGDVVVGDAHPAAAAAGGGFDDDGIADLAGDFQGGLFVIDGAFAAGDGGDLGFFGELFACDFVADGGHRADGRADEFDLAASADLGEVGVLGQESVAGMDRLHVGDFGGGDDAVDLEIAFGGRGVADADRLVGQLQIGGVACRRWNRRRRSGCPSRGRRG